MVLFQTLVLWENLKDGRLAILFIYLFLIYIHQIYLFIFFFCNLCFGFGFIAYQHLLVI